MPPAILLLGVGRRGWLLPLPVFLLWPLALLAALVIGVARLILPARGPRSAVWRWGWIGLRAFCQLHGTRVDVRSNNGERVRLWFI